MKTTDEVVLLSVDLDPQSLASLASNCGMARETLDEDDLVRLAVLLGQRMLAVLVELQYRRNPAVILDARVHVTALRSQTPPGQ